MNRTTFPYYGGLSYWMMTTCFIVSVICALPGISMLHAVLIGRNPLDIFSGGELEPYQIALSVAMPVTVLGFIGIVNSFAPLIQYRISSEQPVKLKIEKIKRLLGKQFELEVKDSNFIVAHGKTGYPIFREGEVQILCFEDQYIFRVIAENMNMWEPGTMDFGSSRHLAKKIKKTLTTDHTP